MRLTTTLAAPLALALVAGAASAAERPITLAEATERALAKNQDLAIERDSFRIALASYERARGSYDPSLRADVRYRDRTDPVNSIISGAPAGELGPTASGFSSSAGVSQLLPSGGVVTLSASASRDRSNNSFTTLSPAYSTSLGIDVRQPLLQNLFIDPARRGLKLSSLGKDRSGASLERVVVDVVAAVERAYWTLLAQRRDVVIRRDSLRLAGEQLSETKARIEAGTLPESDAAQPQAEVERRRGDLYVSEENARRTELALKSLLLDDPADPLWNDTFVPSDEPEFRPAPVDLAAALETASARRPELRDAALRLSQADVDRDAAADRVKPQLDLVASYARRGLAGSKNPYATSFSGGPVVVAPELDGGLGRSFGTIGDGEFPDASIGLAFAFPLGNRAAKADAVVARFQRDQASTSLAQLRQRVAVDVRNAAQTLETAAQRVEAARAGREAAEVQLSAEKERFAVGLTTNFFVLTRQNDLAQARVTEVTAFADWARARSDYARATGTLLDERRITVQNDVPARRADGAAK